MPREINFLSERRKQLTKVEKKDTQIMKILAGILGMVFVFFLLSFGVQLYVDRQLFQLKAAQKVARSQIAENEEIERSFVIFVYKLTSLSNINQDRQEKNAAIDYFSTVFGDSIFIKNIEFDQKEKLLIFRLESNDVFALRKIFDTLKSEEIRQRFASINPSDLKRTITGTYEISVAVVTKKTEGQ
jgi:hypothetical protein